MDEETQETPETEEPVEIQEEPQPQPEPQPEPVQQEPPAPTKEDIFQQKSKLHAYIYFQLTQGVSEQKVILDLIAKGWKPDVVKAVIQEFRQL